MKLPPRRPTSELVQLIAIGGLVTIVLVATIGIVAAALTTDRNLHFAEGLTFGGAVLIAVVGGGVTLWRRKRKDDDAR